MTRNLEQAVFPAAEIYLIRCFMASHAIPEAQWLLGSGLSLLDLERPDLLVSWAQFDTLHRNVFRLVQIPAAGLRFGQALNLSRWGLAGTALLCAETLGHALTLAGELRSLLRSRFTMRARAQGKLVAITARRREGMQFPASEGFAWEFLLGTMHSQISNLLAQPFQFERVALPIPRPPYSALLTPLCRESIIYSASDFVMTLPRETLEKSLPLSNPLLQKQVLKLCEEEVSRIQRAWQQDISWRVRHQLELATLADTDMDQVARQLGLSVRNLRRRLHSQGTSFRELWQQRQLELACTSLLDRHQSIPAVAALCGFRDGASFRRAFRTWTGMTPGEYRRQKSVVGQV